MEDILFNIDNNQQSRVITRRTETEVTRYENSLSNVPSETYYSASACKNVTNRFNGLSSYSNPS